jgi:conjugative relaxase-like TrwC/TraI family protein
VLSVGKLGAGAEDYYLNTVANGREDYYTGAGEAPGVWLGQGACELGLDGAVDADQLHAVLEGRDPWTAADLTAGRVGDGKASAVVGSAPGAV